MKRKLLLSVALLTATIVIVKAQPYPSRLGRFQVDQIKGCASFTVTVTNLLGGACVPGSSPCAIDYGDGTPLQTNPPLPITHTYSTAKTYTLTVIYQSLAVQKDDIALTVVENTQPDYQVLACPNLKAAINVVDNKYQQYVIDFNNDNTPEFVLPFSNSILTPGYTYTTPPPTFTTSVRGRNLASADNCTAKTQPFTPIATLPTPRISALTSLDAASVKLDFTISNNIQYNLEIAVNNSATFQLYQKLYQQNTLTIQNLKLDDNYYCFRIGAFDPCNNVVYSYSGPVCSDKFTATAQSDVNHLVWNTGATSFVSSFNIIRNKNSFFTTTSTSFDDIPPQIVCKTGYCYQIVTNYAGGGKSTSLEKCVTSFSKKIPTAINDVTSVVAATGGVDLSWVQDPAFIPVNYSIQRLSGSAGLAFLTTVTGQKYSDPDYTTEGKYCYQINYQDKCDNFSSPGGLVCPMRLGGSLDKNNVITLGWSAYKGWKNGVKNYEVDKYNVQGALIKTFVTSDTTFVDDQPDPANQLVRYEIKAIPAGAGLVASVSNKVEFVKNANLYYPTAFSPNQDNLNDGFIVSGQFIQKFSMKIFDRWGALLFATEKNEPWDGLRDGKPLPASTYVWKVEITDLAGRTYSQEGTVALIRN